VSTLQRFLVLIPIGVMALASIVASGGGGGGGDSGGEGGGDPIGTDLSGQFVDSAVSGLRYVTSGGTQGTTDASGTFSYKAGETVSFYLGEILIGEASGAAIVTPVSLVPGATDETNTTVSNIARFLQTLDDDDNPDNGIQISAAVSAAGAGMVVDFTLSAADFDAATAAIVDGLTALRSSGARTLVSVADAQLHLAGSLLCGRAGSYEGTWVQTAGPESDNGSWSFTVDTAGAISGSALSNVNTEINPIVISGTVTSGGTSSFEGVGTTSVGATFAGTVALDGSVTGTWENAPFGTSGTYSGSRVSGASEACTGTGGGEGEGSVEPGLGTLTLSGADAAAVGTAFAPPVVSERDTNILRWGTTLANMVEVEFAADGSLTRVSYTRITGDGSYDYSIFCAYDDCSGVTVDENAKTISFSDVAVPAITSWLATGPITLDGTLSYASIPFVVPGDGGDTGGGAITPTGGALDASCPPFNVGDTWAYSITTSSPATSSTVTETVTANDGSVITKQSDFSDSQDYVSTLYVVDGAVLDVEDDFTTSVSTYTTPWQFCPLERSGLAFQEQTTTAGTYTSTSKATVLSVADNVSVTVAAGTYNTTQIDYSFEYTDVGTGITLTGTATFYVASGVGVIKHVDRFGPNTSTTELTSTNF